MSLPSLLQLWKAKGQILEGIMNSVFKKEDVEIIAKDRYEICKTNACGYYDPRGISEKAVVPGVESCAACGCRMQWKIRSLSSACGLDTIGEIPLWEKILDKDEEDKLKAKLGL